MSSRHAAPFIRDVLARFRRKALAPPDAAAELGVSRSRLYVLYASYLASCAQRLAHRWLPGISGGNQRTVWPPDVLALLRKLLGARPPASYSFAASEVHRRHALRLDRATVRRWALAHDLAPDIPTAITPSSSPLRPRTNAPSFSSIAPLHHRVLLCRTLLSCFECNTTPAWFDADTPAPSR